MDYAVLASLAEKEDMRGRSLFLAWKRMFRVPDWKAWFKSFQASQNWKLNEVELKNAINPSMLHTKPFCKNRVVISHTYY